MLVGGRVLQGIGGATDGAGRPAGGAAGTAKRDMLRAIAYLTWPALLAPVIAPAARRLDHHRRVSWHWIFLINIPLGLVAFVVGRAGSCPTDRADRCGRWTGSGFVLCGWRARSAC